MNRFNSLFIFLFLSFFFAVSISSVVIASPDQHVSDAVYFNPDHVVVPTQVRNSTSSKEELDLLNQFTNFIKKYGRSYADENEHAYRLSVFKTNLRRAKRNQKLDPSAAHGITQFSDLTTMEFRRRFLRLGAKRVKHTAVPTSVNRSRILLTDNDPPTDFDYRDKGVVTPVKDQQSCGSSYAFSALGAIEAAYAHNTGEIVDMSEQAIIDCTYRKYNGGLNNQGCDGGSINSSFEEVRQFGFVTEKEYPYTSGRSGTHGPCKTGIDSGHMFLKKFGALNSPNESEIAFNLLRYGPLAVSLKIKPSFLLTYGGGVSCPYISADLDNAADHRHGVVLVGYGSGAYSPIRLKKEPYYIFKNSWGTEFGENGYFKACRGSDTLYEIDELVFVKFDGDNL